MINIRLMTIKDYEAVYNIWKTNTQYINLNEIDDSKEGINKFLKRNPNSCFVAEDKEKIIGTIMAGHDGRRGFIYHTIVLEEYQNNGIGKQLVYNVIKAFQNDNIHKVALGVYNKNKKAYEFWQKLGFSPRKDFIYCDKIISKI